MITQYDNGKAKNRNGLPALKSKTKRPLDSYFVKNNEGIDLPLSRLKTVPGVFRVGISTTYIISISFPNLMVEGTFLPIKQA